MLLCAKSSKKTEPPSWKHKESGRRKKGLFFGKLLHFAKKHLRVDRFGDVFIPAHVVDFHQRIFIGRDHDYARRFSGGHIVFFFFRAYGLQDVKSTENGHGHIEQNKIKRQLFLNGFLISQEGIAAVSDRDTVTDLTEGLKKRFLGFRIILRNKDVPEGRSFSNFSDHDYY